MNASPGSGGRRAVRSRFLLLLVLAFGVAVLPAAATVLSQHYSFEEPVIREIDGFHRVEMPGAWNFGAPGQPDLPLARVSLLLPPGERITAVEIIPGQWTTLSGSYLVEPGQRQYPLSFAGPVESDMPDREIYAAEDPYPGFLHDEARTGLLRGYRIASFALHPVRYTPASGTLEWLRDCEVRISTEPDREVLEQARRRIRHDDKTKATVAGLIDNAPAIAAYRQVERAPAGSRDLDPSDEYRYLIITTAAWAGHLGQFADFETRRGLKAGIFLRDWIDANYPEGEDAAARIRLFIIDAYETWDVDYVLLAGDANDMQGIPHRGLYADAYGSDDPNIPADMYFGCLDGSWDDDMDGLYGEIGEADLYHELGVGRASIRNLTELQNWMTKQMLHQAEPVVADCDEALMAGELLWDHPTWGGDSKDEVKDGSYTHGYTTVGFPPSMNVDTLYDRDGGTWEASTLISMMSEGLSIVNHLGHCGTSYMMRFVPSNIPEFMNDGINHNFNFVYSQGCYPGAFDANCIAEDLNGFHRGAVALVVNSRYGFGEAMGTGGSSQYLDRQFFDAVFGEGIYPLSEINNDSKEDNIWIIDYEAIRWCCYQLNLFGDPAMHLWTSEPAPLDVDHIAGITLGEHEIEVTVQSLGQPVAGATVTISDPDFDVYSTGLTDAYGSIPLTVLAAELQDLTVTVRSHDFVPYEGEIIVVPCEGAYLIFEDYAVDDDMFGESQGNGMGSASAGETIELAVSVRNIGIQMAPGVTGVLSSTDPLVTIIDADEDFGDIASDSLKTCLDDFDFSIDGSCPDGSSLEFTLVMTSGEDQWTSQFTLPVASAALSVLDWQIHDEDGNGLINLGETVGLAIGIENAGGEGSGAVSASLSSVDPYVVLGNASAGAADVAAYGSALLEPDFEFILQPGCPDFHELAFNLHLETDWGYTADLPVFVRAVTAWEEAAAEPLNDAAWSMGIAWGDANGDGLEDLYVSNLNVDNRFFGNLGGGLFEDLTVPPLDGGGTCQGVAWADMDNDGDLDLYVSRTSGQSNFLFRNDDGVFTDASEGPQGDPGYCQESCWGDYDGDGLVDLFITNAFSPDRLLRNEGEGIFRDMTAAPLGDDAYGRSASWADYDDDGDMDLYLVHQSANILYRNEDDGGFVLVPGPPLADGGDGWGAAWADYDNDGDLDVYIANNGPDRLLRNEGGGSFVDATDGDLASEDNTRAAAWGDYDNDGLIDLYIVGESGNRLLHNQGAGVFVDATRSPLAGDGNGSSAAWADVDGDGDLDLYLANREAPNRLYRNDSDRGNRWLHLDLVGVSSNRSALGARVLCWAGEHFQSRQVGADAGFMSRNSLTVEFGLGLAGEVDSLRIFWPSGWVQSLYGLAANQRLEIEEEVGTAAGENLPDRVSLDANYPNPFNPRTEIRFALPESEAVYLRVYDVSGRLVKVLAAGETRPAGWQGIVWKGRDEAGRPVSSGVYFYSFRAGSYEETRKMVLLK